MPDIMAFTSATPADSRYNDVSPTATQPASTQVELFRREFMKNNGNRIEARAKLALIQVEGNFDQDEVRRANAAIREAVEVVSPIEFGVMPWIGISDDCIVSMHWERCDEGVLLTFAGDGLMGLALKVAPDMSYAAGFAERNASAGLPDNIRAQISRLSAVEAD